MARTIAARGPCEKWVSLMPPLPDNHVPTSVLLRISVRLVPRVEARARQSSRSHYLEEVGSDGGESWKALGAAPIPRRHVHR